LTAGSEIARDTDFALVFFGMWADAGLCLWKAGRFGAALTIFEKVLLELKGHPNSPELDMPAFKLRKSLGQVLIHAYSQAEGEAPNERNYCPKVGFCSDLEKADQIRHLPVGDDRVLWALLVGIEAQLGLRRGLFEKQLPLLDACRISATAFMTNSAAVATYLNTGRMEALPARIAKHAHDLALAKALHAKGHNTLVELSENFELPATEEEQTEAMYMFLGCLVCLIARREMNSQVVTSLSEAIARVTGSKKMAELIKLYDEVIALESSEQFKRMCSAAIPYTERTICAALAMYGENLSVEQLFRCHVTLVLNLNVNVLRKIVGRELAKVFSSQWLERIRATFALRTPNITVPTIIEACNLPFDNMLKAATILLEISHAVDVRIDERVIRELEVAAGKTTGKQMAQ